MKGYLGKILKVDLTTGEIEEEAIPDNVYENVLSGIGLGAWYLYNQIPADADPLGPDNILGFTSGLLVGSGSLITGRWMAVCKSPLTGGWGDANCGGDFAPGIKACGYDAIFFRGISPTPVFLQVDKDGAVLRDATELWGTDAIETEDILRKECAVGGTPRVVTIGPAGEKKSLISGIVNDGGRIAARSGVGAVMGSKQLKAVVLSGNQRTKIADPKSMKAYSKEFGAKVKQANAPGFLKGYIFPILGNLTSKVKSVSATDGMMSVMLNKSYGTIAVNTMGLPNGDSPVKNWGGSVKDFSFRKYRKLNPDRVLARKTKNYACYSCTIQCGDICDISDLTDGKIEHTHKPEYENCCALGTNLLINDLDEIFLMSEALNRAGMDSISAGSTLGFAFECFEKGLITEADTGGLKLVWGDAKAASRLLDMMINREGIGDILADGVKVASEKIGGNSALYANHCGGQEPGMHDPKLDPMLGVHFSADPTPGRHTIGAGLYYNMMNLWQEVSWAPKVTKYPKSEEYIPSDDEALKSVALACYKMLNDGAGGCFFALIAGLDHWNLFRMLNDTTGWGLTADEYMAIGRRIQTLRQLFSVKHGVEPKDAIMRGRVMGDPPLESGNLKGITLPIDEMVALHWKHFGWNEHTGLPEQEIVGELKERALVQ
ncbi:MAG: aldehyde ferredoxin oxidoreductase C-terminal domain-containing protein [Myxococcota bacterium]|jgi:aldehyde:ferredoxin oxidoreductase|nr:aldehyde ferredoxin oxidoreductase C-terminal domain-containing protein [Myxococcota bacterium]